MSEINQENCQTYIREWMQKTESETLAKMSMWMRFNYLSNMIAKMLNNGYTEADVDWGRLNHLLSDNRNEYDFNNYDKIHSRDDLMNARELCIETSVMYDFGVWQVHTCKDCNKKFYLTLSEVEFFKSKNLRVPKRCRECREKRKEFNG